MARAATDDTWSSLTNCSDGGKQKHHATATVALTAGKYCHRPTPQDKATRTFFTFVFRCNYSLTPCSNAAFNTDPVSSLFPSFTFLCVTPSLSHELLSVHHFLASHTACITWHSLGSSSPCITQSPSLLPDLLCVHHFLAFTLRLYRLALPVSFCNSDFCL